MLPIVWFYIAAVSFMLILLLYTELRNQARRHVKGCSSLHYISPERLNSLIIIEPDLEILELGFQQSNAGIPDAHRVPVDQLEGFVRDTHAAQQQLQHQIVRQVKRPLWRSTS